MIRRVVEDCRRADILFHGSGRIDITAGVAVSLGLAEGDVIGLAEQGGECYLYRRFTADAPGRYKGRLHRTNKGSRYLRTWSGELCRHIGLITGCDESYLMCGEPVLLPELGKVLPVITRLNLYSNDKECQVQGNDNVPKRL